MTLTDIVGALTPDLKAVLDLVKDGLLFIAGVGVESLRQRWKLVRQTKASARKALNVLIDRPNLLLSRGLPMEALELLVSRLSFKRNRLRKAIARCQRAKEHARQDAVGQPFVDETEARAALMELRDAL